ncbi:hypothetical protein ABLB95_10915 [Acinetobacter radioresistens]|uniref:hypothetical protein n=1 Tax=Acinetobacter radioresistens TaxID=40216 RepID=UPI0032B3CD62
MSINQKLKNCFFDFLSNKTFSGYEFKDLRQLFITCYPEFSSKKYYSKIYQVVRELAALGLILIDKATCTYKYTSNYTQTGFLNRVDINETMQVKSQLLLEYDRVLIAIDNLHNEITIYQSYLDRFPLLTEIILNFISKRKNEIDLLQCEIQAINHLLEAC